MEEDEPGSEKFYEARRSSFAAMGGHEVHVNHVVRFETLQQIIST